MNLKCKADPQKWLEWTTLRPQQSSYVAVKHLLLVSDKLMRRGREEEPQLF